MKSNEAEQRALRFRELLESKLYQDTLGDLITKEKDRCIRFAQEQTVPTEALKFLGAHMGLTRLEAAAKNIIDVGDREKRKRIKKLNDKELGQGVES